MSKRKRIENARHSCMNPNGFRPEKTIKVNDMIRAYKEREIDGIFE